MAKEKRTVNVPTAGLAMPDERLRAIQERRRSNAAGGHDSRPRRERNRSAAKQAAVRREFD